MILYYPLDKSNMASNKKINVPISSFSYDEIYAMLDAIDSEDEEDIENLMNDSHTELIDESAVESGDLENDITSIEARTEIESTSIPTTTPIEAVIRIANPESESEVDDTPLSSLSTVKDVDWKWRKQYKKQRTCRRRYSEH